MARDDAHHPGHRALLLLLFVMQIPWLLCSRSAHAAVVDPAAMTAAAAVRRLLRPVPAVHEQQSVEAVKNKVAAHPWSMEMETRARRRSGSGGSAFVNAVSKHQVPSGANPDSN
ncbi:unnamed protein product [Urochloa decumbens]|uniref:Uncharacterized protein n=1 Tax=Urochloa decumbens TaxID=240449 RepID=A0ABC9AFE1_9POAL